MQLTVTQKTTNLGLLIKQWGSFYFLKTNLLGPQICDTLLLSLVLFLRVNSLWSLIVNFVNIEEEETEPISNEGNVEDVPTGWALEEVGRDPFQVVQVQALRLSIFTCYFRSIVLLLPWHDFENRNMQLKVCHLWQMGEEVSHLISTPSSLIFGRL